MDAAILEKEALQLPDGERAVLAERLLESLSRVTSQTRDAWIHEADSRMKAFHAGELTAVDGPQALEDLRNRFRK